jgi:hypothetical protein
MEPQDTKIFCDVIVTPFQRFLFFFLSCFLSFLVAKKKKKKEETDRLTDRPQPWEDRVVSVQHASSPPGGA